MIRFVEVKDQDITMGDRCCSDSCAIALALRHEYDPTRRIERKKKLDKEKLTIGREDYQIDIEVALENDELKLYVDRKELEIDPSQIKYVRRFINDFDNGRYVEPFTLRIIEQVG